jgi:uncharacterized membrane protein
MVHPKNMSAKFLVITAIRRVIVIIGCLLFVFSIISPFYFVSNTFGGTGFSGYYWSYKSDYYWSMDLVGSGSSHPWFSSYWFNPSSAEGLGIPWILVALFTVQVLTLVFGVAFIVSNKRMLSFGLIAFSIAVLVLMTYTGERANELAGTFNGKGYQMGYNLVCISLAMFLFAFLLNEVTKMQATRPASAR